MFDNLSEKLGGILDRLTGRGALTEKDVDAAMREVRRALLEADVALEVVRSFTERVREQAIGATVVKSVTPGQMVVKIVHDELVNTLGSDGQTIDVNAVPPTGVEGLEMTANGAELTPNGVLGIGPLAIGNIKYKTEFGLFQKMIKAEKPVRFDFRDAFALARELNA